jgi:hypothetical protein
VNGEERNLGTLKGVPGFNDSTKAVGKGLNGVNDVAQRSSELLIGVIMERSFYSLGL